MSSLQEFITSRYIEEAILTKTTTTSTTKNYITKEYEQIIEETE